MTCLNVTVDDEPEISRSVRVSADGMIRLPMLKRQLKVEGLMPAEVESEIASELKAEQILVDPIVTVSISEYQNHPISVIGAVVSPVTFQATMPVTLLRAITRAGGLSDEAGLEILVTRTKKVSGEEKTTISTQRIPVKGLIDAADPELNVTLYGGEVIRVPALGKVFVAGMVKNPGAFPLDSSSETTVLQMLAISQALQGATTGEAYIYRRDAAGSQSTIPVDLKKILAGQAPDVPLIANDILYIAGDKEPGEKGRKFPIFGKAEK